MGLDLEKMQSDQSAAVGRSRLSVQFTGVCTAKTSSTLAKKINRRETIFGNSVPSGSIRPGRRFQRSGFPHALRGLRLRRKLFKGDVNGRHFGPGAFLRAATRAKTSDRNFTAYYQPIRWRTVPTEDGKSPPLKPATQSKMPLRRPAH